MKSDVDGVLTIHKLSKDVKSDLHDLALFGSYLTPIEKNTNYRYFEVHSVSGHTLKIVRTIKEARDVKLEDIRKIIKKRMEYLKYKWIIISAGLTGLLGGVLADWILSLITQPATP